MNIALAENGQIALGMAFLEHLGVQPGDQVSVQKMPDGKLEITAETDGWTASQAKAYFRRLFADNTIHATIEDMNEAIARGASAGFDKK